ncbi:MAG TPA: MBL fold metallo-hydrolase [Bacteroidia bacterium]|jgi:glyoxylase-like metal-dependent hydrolase (beta-lactamase superfamily II)/rhodanese-related sulfurtransferase|nr:MBL fold metallo-hydrolase [Bacteroidia bacterium]HQK97137.1 MBL fold metallo-hydrolase [Bacteroidia bacterium]
MKIEQIYTGCLAEAAYYIESNGEVAIIDPLRDVSPYIDRANRNNGSIKYIFETHFHADFVSGHIDLAKKTGAKIVFGPTAAPGYDAYIAKDEEVFPLGNVFIKALHTPGHTMESSCFLLLDENKKEVAVFTGDTLFIGDVGRPDLVQKVKADVTPQILAAHLYNSLRTKLMVLPDDVIVYPGHGAGSACGKSMSKETTDTIGHQKQVNYALEASLTVEKFTDKLLDGLVEPPQYFPANVILNLKGSVKSVDDVVKAGTQALSPSEFSTVWESLNALVLDTRKKEAFSAAHIPGAVFIGLDDNFAPWVGTLIPDLNQAILLITEEGREEEAVIRLSRVGYDNPVGFLKGGMEVWIAAGNKVEVLAQITPGDFERMFSGGSIEARDVRRKSEYDTEHIEGVENFPLDFINKNLSSLNKEKTYYLHCQGGYRSVIACSILMSKGFSKVVNVLGGYKELAQTNLKRTQFHKQNTEL